MPEFNSETGPQPGHPSKAPPPSRQEASRLGADLSLGGAAAAGAVRQLLQLPPASLARCRGDNGWTPLHYCALGGDASADAAAELLAAGAEPDAVDEAGWTPLHQAADKNSCRVAAELLARPSCQPDRRCPEGRTPMSLAAESWRGSARMVRLLLTAGSSAEAAAEAAKIAESAAATLPSSCGKSVIARLLLAAAAGWLQAGGRARKQASSSKKQIAPLRCPFECGCHLATNSSEKGKLKFSSSFNKDDASISGSSSDGGGGGSSGSPIRDLECSCTNAVASLSCRQCGAHLLIRRLTPADGQTVGRWRRELAEASPKLPGPRQLVAHHLKRCRSSRQAAFEEDATIDEADAAAARANDAWRVRILARSESPDELELMEKILVGRLMPQAPASSDKWQK